MSGILLALSLLVAAFSQSWSARTFAHAASSSAGIEGPPETRDEDAKREIERWENAALQADLRGDASFYENNLADDWTGGTSWGTFQTKAMLVADLKNSKTNITTKETLSQMQVRVYGDAAVSTYTESYDALIHGKRTVKTIVTTDTFVRREGRWIQVAAHSSAVS
jgi:hypothetical protein